MSDWCRHYNGIMGRMLGEIDRQCEAGVVYSSIKATEEPTKVYNRYPCFEDSTVDTCPLRSFYTDEEKAENKRQSDRAVADWLHKLESNICPHCDTPITSKRQVGRCVYAEPCGCRLYQGRLTAAEKAGR